MAGHGVDNRSQRDGSFQKAMRRYVPSGSVYFFEAEGGVALRKSYLIDDDTEGQIGFGLAIFGQWSYAQI